MEQDRISQKIKIIIIKLHKNFTIAPYLHWFDNITQQKICSYYQHNDQLIAFTSQLLQKYYLASMLDININELQFSFTEYHKPFIATPFALARKLNYNVAHSQDYVVMAIYSGSDFHIGVDIEYIDHKLDIDPMSPIVFSVSEQQLIGKSNINFFKLWTKKEALIKALGTGFATDFYQDTQLNLNDYEINENFIIITQTLKDYFLSICLHKS